ncbi:hypothetical protein E2320_006629, partial [Naja naja]
MSSRPSSGPLGTPNGNRSPALIPDTPFLSFLPPKVACLLPLSPSIPQYRQPSRGEHACKKGFGALQHFHNATWFQAKKDLLALSYPLCCFPLSKQDRTEVEVTNQACDFPVPSKTSPLVPEVFFGGGGYCLSPPLQFGHSFILETDKNILLGSGREVSLRSADWVFHAFFCSIPEDLRYRTLKSFNPRKLLNSKKDPFSPRENFLVHLGIKVDCFSSSLAHFTPREGRVNTRHPLLRPQNLPVSFKSREVSGSFFFLGRNAISGIVGYLKEEKHDVISG